MISRLLTLVLLLAACFYQDVAANLPPTFVNDMSNAVISESTQVGQKVYTLLGVDPEDSPVKYGIIGTDKFLVNSTTGEVFLAKELDREANDTLRFEVTVEDEVPNGRNNLVKIPISVIVVDENDNAPQFKGIPYEVDIPEDTDVGVTIFRDIFVTDADITGETLEVTCMERGDPSKESSNCSTFSVVAINVSSRFYTGAVILKKALDYSQKHFYQLLLNASDGIHYSTAILEIKIEDVQNTPPEFLGSLTGIISEDEAVNTVVMKIHARDGDHAQPRPIFYELLLNPHEFFSLDSKTGELRIARPLDKESLEDTTGVMKLLVRAQEVVNNFPINDPLTATTAEITITIKDVNDEPPTFDQREYSVTVNESSKIGSVLNLNMTVVDTDVGTNSAFSLKLLDVSGVFEVEPTSAVGSTTVNIRIANGSFDYENPNQRKFIIQVVAEEIYTDPPLSSTATVTVNVMDINDNMPVFDQTGYTAEVSETASAGTVVATITAKDRDSGDNGENGLVYEIFGPGAEKFVINEKTGVITVANCSEPGSPHCLDFETKDKYFLTFKATDNNGHGLSNSISLMISLLDSNDNPPYFVNENVKASIDESAKKFEPPLKVQARDIDKTSRITYAISDGNIYNMFSINNITGEITVTEENGLELKNVSVDSVQLTVVASDEVHIAYAQVNIAIKDVNNNNPEFDQESYFISIPEDTPVGTTVEQPKASDMDTGVNAEIVYQIQQGSFDDFAMDNETGHITVSKKLDYDRRKLYNVEVIAQDMGVPSLTGTATVTIKIINSNDKDPYFLPATQRTEVPENSLPGTIIYRLEARDPDVNDSRALSFALSEPITAVDKNGKQVTNTEDFKTFFSINSTSGDVIVSKHLERDVAAVVTMTVLVIDITAQAVQQGKGTLVVTITDVNDYSPIFVKPWTPIDPNYTVDMREEQPVGSVLHTFVAFDQDSNIERYAIEPESEFFDVHNKSGAVLIKQRIDYEKVKSLNFTLVAYDSGKPQKSVSAYVTVNVININDMDPVFSMSTYIASVKENSPIGTHVVTVSAVDGDEGVYGAVTYSLIGEHSSDFKIDPESGEITVANPKILDRENIPVIYIQVMAADGAPSERTSSVPVRINLVDVNDNPPVFKQKYYKVSFEIKLNASSSPILQVLAEDADEGVNGAVRYRIVSGNINDAFSINEETGLLYASSSLEEIPRNITLVVQAIDGEGNGVFSDQATINIELLEHNKHSPVFTVPAYNNAVIEVSEEDVSVPHFQILNVKARDEDTGKNGHVSYYFCQENEKVQETNEFSIDPETGDIRTKIILDRETKEIYELCLVAKDHGDPVSHETFMFVTVHILDSDDNKPEFPIPDGIYHYKFRILENQHPDAVVGSVLAVDRDTEKFATIYYFIMNEKEDSCFSINKRDGTIYAKCQLDREQKDSYELYVKATNDPNYFTTAKELADVGNTHHNKDLSVAHVLITVLDENDNSPKFHKANYYKALYNVATINEFVVKLEAFDPDSGDNGTVRYHIAASNIYRRGSGKPAGSIIPSPFKISEDGKIETANYMAEYNQDLFVLKVVAEEVADPNHSDTTKVHVWICEPAQLIRVIISQPPDKVNQVKDLIVSEFSNVTHKLVVVDEIRYHIKDNGQRNVNWSDLIIHGVERDTLAIVPVSNMLKMIDSNYDTLRDHFSGHFIENVLPAFVSEHEKHMDNAVATGISLSTVLVIGLITVIVVWMLMKHCNYNTQSHLKKKDGLIKKEFVDDLTTTENPLWIERKLKVYEEQELSMNVFSDSDNALTNSPVSDQEGRNSAEFSQVDNTYATIQHPRRQGSPHTVTSLGIDDQGDYATLSARMNIQNGNSTQGSFHGMPREAFAGSLDFQGCTFQPGNMDKRKMNNNHFDSPMNLSKL